MTLTTWRLVKTAVSLMREYDTHEEFRQAMPEINAALTFTDALFT
jgi:hypothetical protein